MHTSKLSTCLAFVALGLSNAACGGDGSLPPQPAVADVPTAPAHDATANASAAGTASPLPTAAASAGAETKGPCPPEPRGHIKEGTAVLNATPDDLAVTLSPDGKTPPRPKLKFDDAKGAPAKPSGAFAIWHDQGTWHLHATGKGAKPSTLYQARISSVSDVAAEEGDASLRVVNHPRLTPGRCWNDPPKGDPSHAFAGFDLTWGGKSRGISFKVPDQACFTVTLRVANKQELPVVQIGSAGKPPKAAKGQDTIELCP